MRSELIKYILLDDGRIEGIKIDIGDCLRFDFLNQVIVHCTLIYISPKNQSTGVPVTASRDVACCSSRTIVRASGSCLDASCTREEIPFIWILS